MSDIIDDGGPAFPNLELRHSCGDPCIEASTGMSLRDWFAGHASEEDIKAHTHGKWVNDRWLNGTTREEARYAYADAMLVARKGKS